jgi:predicted DsbA family dithiol-disulfide isomerase
MTMDLEIWSDIACPWCYIGKRRFESALEQFEHADQVRVTWRSFELDPDAPPEREGDRATRIARKYGLTLERVQEMERHLLEQAAGEGLEFRFDIARSGSTFDGHRLVHLAAEHDRQDAMKERLLSAYFTEGTLIADHESLVELGVEVGVPAEQIRELLAGDRFAAEVREDERTALALGITAVPTFVVDRQRGVSGAQTPDLLLNLLRKGWEASYAARLAEPSEANSAISSASRSG